MKEPQMLPREKGTAKTLKDIQQLATELKQGSLLDILFKSGEQITMIFSHPQNMCLPTGNFFIYGQRSDSGTVLRLEDVQRITLLKNKNIGHDDLIKNIMFLSYPYKDRLTSKQVLREKETKG